MAPPGFLLALTLAAVALPASPGAPLRRPSLVPGEMLRYRLEYRSGISSRSRGPIHTPDAAGHMTVSLSAGLRLDVLSVKTDPTLGLLTRLRVTYESLDALVHTDAFDPGAGALEKQYRALDGRSFEFTIDGDARILDVGGLARIEPDERARQAVREWLGALTLPLGLRQTGRKPGQEWSSVLVLPDAPLTGLAWRTRSIYRDDEPCPPAPGAPAALDRGACAVIRSRFETIRRGPRGDPTPPAYSRQGLRTRGTWQARGESLSYLSLATGLVAASTATENSDIDLTIQAVLSGSQLRYAGSVRSTSELTLVTLSLPPPSPRATGSR